MALQKRLESLSAQAATLFSDVEVRMLDASVHVSELRPLLSKIKDLFVEIDCVAMEQLSVKDSKEKNLLSRLIEQERIRKSEVDQRVAAWFEQRGCKDGGETSSWREDPIKRSETSKVSTSRISSRSHSHSTSHSKTAEVGYSSLVKRELARLKLSQLQDSSALQSNSSYLSSAKKRSARDSASTRRWNANVKPRSAKHNVNVKQRRARQNASMKQRTANTKKRSARHSANAKNGSENWS